MEKIIQPLDIKHIMERSCLNKRSYTIKQANNVVELAYSQDKLFYYYKCQFCSSIHLTSKVPGGTFQQLKVV